MHDTVAFVKLQALAIVFKLLAGNAEQEQNLLRLGVNKLVSMLQKFPVQPRSRLTCCTFHRVTLTNRSRPKLRT